MRTALTALALTLSLVACGGPAATPEQKADMAKALQRLYAADQASTDAPAITKGLVLTDNKSVAGKKGTAKVTTHTEVDMNGSISTRLTYTIEYTGYSADGINVFDGTEVMSTKVTAGSDGAAVSHSLKGKVTMTGEYTTVLEHDVAIVAEAGASGVKLTITGNAAADQIPFSFAGETFDVSPTVN